MLKKTSRKKGRTRQTKVPARKQERKIEKKEKKSDIPYNNGKTATAVRRRPVWFTSVHRCLVPYGLVQFSSFGFGSVRFKIGSAALWRLLCLFYEVKFFNFNATESTMQKSVTWAKSHWEYPES